VLCRYDPSILVDAYVAFVNYDNHSKCATECGQYIVQLRIQ